MESFYSLFLDQLRVWSSGVTWVWEEFLAPLTSLLHEDKTEALLGSSLTWKQRRKFAVLNFLFVELALVRAHTVWCSLPS